MARKTVKTARQAKPRAAVKKAARQGKPRAAVKKTAGLVKRKTAPQPAVAQEMKLRDGTSNPAPLGLMGFGMTTVLLNLHNAGLFPVGTMILGMGIFYGGIAQVIAGIMEWKKGNTFGTVAFTSYGLFWLSLVALLVLPKAGTGIIAPTSAAMGMYLLMWGLFTGCLFVGTLRLNLALQVVFSSLTLLFVLLALAKFTGSAALHVIAGIEGIICGLSAMYTAVALILNEVYGRDVLRITKK